MNNPVPTLVALTGNIFTGGKLHPPLSRRSTPVFDPATGKQVCCVGWAGAADVRSAIESSEQAFEKWRRVAPVERSRVLHGIASLMRTYVDNLANLMTTEQGKPLREAKAEVLYGADYFDWFSGEARRCYGDTIPADAPDKRILVIREPLGVAAAITPWNFPIAMIARKAGAALAAGCTFIVKPAPETPLSALALASLCAFAGLPSDVFNVLPGDAEEVAGCFFESPIVRKISFTGSTEVGKLLIRNSAATVKRLTLELGGNAPFIVLKDADIERTIEAALFAKYRNGGQACSAANRFLVHSKNVLKFSEAFSTASSKLKVGSGLDPQSDLGPLISDEAVAKVRRIVTEAISEGAVRLLGPDPSSLTSRFVPPIILTGVTPKMSIWREEVFGPVTAITEFEDVNEVPALANDTKHGLIAYLFGRDVSQLLRLGESLNFGMIGINDSKIMSVQAPFGGTKESGYGREGSKYGMDEYVNVKYVCLNVGG